MVDAFRGIPLEGIEVRLTTVEEGCSDDLLFPMCTRLQASGVTDAEGHYLLTYLDEGNLTPEAISIGAGAPDVEGRRFIPFELSLLGAAPAPLIDASLEPYAADSIGIFIEPVPGTNDIHLSPDLATVAVLYPWVTGVLVVRYEGYVPLEAIEPIVWGTSHVPGETLLSLDPTNSGVVVYSGSLSGLDFLDPVANGGHYTYAAHGFDAYGVYLQPSTADRFAYDLSAP